MILALCFVHYSNVFIRPQDCGFDFMKLKMLNFTSMD